MDGVANAFANGFANGFQAQAHRAPCGRRCALLAALTARTAEPLEKINAPSRCPETCSSFPETSLSGNMF